MANDLTGRSRAEETTLSPTLSVRASDEHALWSAAKQYAQFACDFCCCYLGRFPFNGPTGVRLRYEQEDAHRCSRDHTPAPYAPPGSTRQNLHKGKDIGEAAGVRLCKYAASSIASSAAAIPTYLTYRTSSCCCRCQPATAFSSRLLKSSMAAESAFL